MAMVKLDDPDFEVFENIPVDEYFENNISKLPDDLSPEEKRKLLNDSKFWGNQGDMIQVPRDFSQILLDQPKEKKALKGINKDMSDNKISVAYPNYDEYIPIAPQRNTTKWLDAVKEIYYRVHKGLSKGQALENVIAGWDNMEKLDFKNWLKFYEEKTHKKYSEASDQPIQIKVGQVGYWEDSNRAGYFVPVHREQEDVGRAIDTAQNPSTNEGMQQEEKREIIERLRNKIVSRLDSAEKILRSQEGQIFAGNEFEALMHIIYELKKKIHTVNKISVSTKLYTDMIIREANILTKKGYRKASDVLIKIAEDMPLTPAPPPSPASGGGLPGEITEAGPVGGSPSMGAPSPMPPTPGPGAPPVTPPAPSAPPAEKIDQGMEEFLNGLSGKKDEQKSDDLEITEDVGEAWVVEAQAAPLPPPTPKSPLPAKDKPPAELEVDESPDAVAPKASPAPVGESQFDQKISHMFDGITIQDVVQKLEDNTKIYKTRQMPRELSMIDMMLDHLGLAPFFPTLAEATNRSLDANQYILTRLEDITSRLRGTVQTNDIDLKGSNSIPSTPELDATREKLQSEQDKEKSRKQLKKQQENSEVDQQSKPEPELEVEEDLGGPVATPGAPAPAGPPPKPPTAPVR